MANTAAVNTTVAALTKDEVEHVVRDFYHLLDIHAPQVQVIRHISEGELEMVFPEMTMRNQAEFEGWYQGVIRIFFDEIHTLQKLDVRLSEDGARADVDIVVRWEASRWKPPAPNSERLRMDAYQRWVIKRSPATGRAVITGYYVDELKVLEGGVPL